MGIIGRKHIGVIKAHVSSVDYDVRMYQMYVVSPYTSRRGEMVEPGEIEMEMPDGSAVELAGEGKLVHLGTGILLTFDEGAVQRLLDNFKLYECQQGMELIERDGM